MEPLFTTDSSCERGIRHSALMHGVNRTRRGARTLTQRSTDRCNPIENAAAQLRTGTGESRTPKATRSHQKGLTISGEDEGNVATSAAVPHVHSPLTIAPQGRRTFRGSKAGIPANMTNAPMPKAEEASLTATFHSISSIAMSKAQGPDGQSSL